MTRKLYSLLLAIAAFIFMFAAVPAYATHLRGTSLTWAPTGVPGQVTFTIQFSDRTDFAGQCNTTTCALGSTLPVVINFGDGSSGTIVTTVTSLNVAEDYLTATGTITHTYTGAGPYTAYYSDCCRINTLVSGGNDSATMRLETLVSPRATPAIYAPVVSEPAIITIPLQNTTGFLINASSFTGNKLTYRLSTAEEMFQEAAFSCSAEQPPGLSVNATSGQVTWNIAAITAAGCGFAAPKAGDLWAAQFMVQSVNSSGTVLAKTPLDVILTFSSSTEAPPTLNFSNPGPITAIAGRQISFTATGNDTAAGSDVTLNNSNLPSGASATNLNAELAPPVVSTFTWTPTQAQVGTNYVISYSVTNDTLEQTTGSVTINVVKPQAPVLSCPASLSTQYLVPLTVPITVTDPQSDAVTVIFTVDGTTVQTSSVPATGSTTNLSINQLIGSAGHHSVGVSASNTDSQSSSCSIPVTVTPVPQAINFTPAPTSPDVAGDSVVLSATGGGSGNPVVFSVLSGPATLAADGVTLTYTGAGTVVVAANQAASADGNYAAAALATAMIVVNPAGAAYNGGTVPVAQQSSVLTATLNFPNGGTLGSLNYLTQGAPNLDFIGNTSPGWTRGPNSPTNNPIPVCGVGTVYAAGQICTVSYIFQPTHPGLRLGAIAAVDTNGNPMGTSYLRGLGTGPQVVFPGNKTTNALGSGYRQPYAVAVDALGNVYVADTLNGAIKEIVAVGGSIPANPTMRTLVSGLTGPCGVAVDGAGNVFFSDADANVVKEIVAVGGRIPAVPSFLTLSNAFSNPHGIAVDGAGNVYVADLYNQAVKVIVAVGGSIPSNPAILSLGSGWLKPEGVAVDSAGNVYVADAGYSGVQELASVGGSFPVGGSLNTLGSFNSPVGVAVDGNGNVYVADASSSVTEIVAIGGTVNVANPNNLAILKLGSGFSSPQGLAVDGAGNVYVADSSQTSVTELPLATPPSLSFAGTDVGLTSSDSPNTVTVANNGYDPTGINPLTFSGVATGTTSFVLDPATTCSASSSLEPGQSCALKVDFAPTTPGTPLTDAVTLNDNNLNNILSTSSPQSVPLSGNGLQQAPVVIVAPAIVAYGTATAGLSATISFAGAAAPTGAVSFSIDSGTPVLASCTGTTSPLTCTASYPSSTLGVPSHTIAASIAPTPGFLAASGSNTLTVTPAALTVTAGSYSGTYDGAAHTLSACTVSANFDGLTCGNSPAGPVGPDAGGAVVVPVVNGSTANYNVTVVNGSWSIAALPVTVTAGSYSGVYDGKAHAPSACTSSYAGVSCANNPASVGPGVGAGATNPVASTGTGIPADYIVTSVAGTYSITKLAASVTPNAAGKIYGTADPVLTGTLSGFLPADGITATYSRVAGETVAGSPYTITATLSPTAPLSNYAITLNTAAFTIGKATPALTWATPASITYGTALSAAQLNAAANPGGGTFVYTPSGGTVLGAGSQPLSVLYTSADTSDYTTATTTVQLTVGQATPVVTWANPPSIVYGTGTGAAQKTATATGVGGVSLPGSYFYTTPDGTIFNVGTHPLGVGFTPTDSTDYVPVSAYATLTVTKATPTVIWSAPAAITYGTALSSAQLNAIASVPGSYNYSPAAGAVLHAGAQTLSVTFTPADASDYNPVSTSVPLTVNKATPVITWPTPAAITYGTPLSATQLDATANVPGTFLYTALTGPNPLGVLLPPGTTALSATLTPTDSVDYNSVTAYVVFTVSKAQTSTTIAVATTQTVTGTTATITATVHPQIGGTPTGTVTYYSGSTALGSAAVGTPFTTGVLAVGTNQITAVYSGDSNFTGSSSSATVITSIAPTNITLIPALTHVFYPASSVSYTVIVPLKPLQLLSGTITIYDGTTVIGTYSVLPTGVLAGVTPQLSVGTHNLRAVYSGNAQYPPGESPIQTVTVSAL